MITTPPSIRLARRDDLPVLAEVMARAFAEDPFFSWLAGAGPRPAERMLIGWAGLLRHASAGLSATYTTADLAGVAMWIPPGRKASTTLDSLRLTPTLGRLTGWGRLREVAAVLELMEARRHHHVPKPPATARNVVLYERLGFETVGQLTLPGTDSRAG